jgi:hypothetical protein
MTKLSPAAQAVMDAFLAGWPDEALEQDRRCLAAALRAVAHQVVPEEPDLSPEEASDLVLWGKWTQRTRIHDKILAIVAELEVQ